MLNLPLGMSEFSELRKKNRLYVDKTKYIYSLLTKNTRTFFSRPRRFGKSLFLSTLEQALLGNKELFKNLWIADSDYDWTPYGVIRLDFSGLDSKTPDALEKSLINSLLNTAKNYDLTIKTDFIGMKDALATVAAALHAKFGHVAILIDEYDYPILHALHDKTLAISIREIIKDFSSAIKAQQTHIEFVFVTGVSAFTKSGLSAGLNNLTNLTLSSEFSGVCGYNDKEIDLFFKEHLEDWATQKSIPYTELKNQLKTWYNGYLFKEQTLTIYSPFSLTCAIGLQELQNFWFESATPQFLLDELNKTERLEECNFLNLDNFQGTTSLLQTFEVENIPLTALLFQMGYLTIDTYDEEARMYQLKYPNLEVKTALHKHLLIVLTKIKAAPFDTLISKLFLSLRQENMEELMACFTSILSNIPYQLHQKQEKFYHAILQALFISANIKSHAEYSTSQGRADIVLDMPSMIYIIELKLNKSPEEALMQIETQKYYEPFLHQGKPVRALGISFTRKKASKKEKSQFSINYVTRKL